MKYSWRCRALSGLVLAASAATLVRPVPASAAALPAVAPANDNFASAQVLPANTAGYVVGSNVDATAEQGEPKNAGIWPTASIWYRFKSLTTRKVVFRTCGSTFDTVLGVYTGAVVSALRGVVHNDDACGLQSEVFFTAVAGVAYSIVVDTTFYDEGTVVLSWGPPPANDMFAGATAITTATGTAKGDSVGTTKETGETRHDDLLPKHTVWYRYMPPANGTLTLDTCGSSYDTVLALTTGATVSTQKEVAANDDSCGRQSWLTAAVTSGVPLQIVIDVYDDDCGPYVLHWAFAAAAKK